MTTKNISDAQIIHDMRNLMSTIAANCEILREDERLGRNPIFGDVSDAIVHLNVMLNCYLGHYQESDGTTSSSVSSSVVHAAHLVGGRFRRVLIEVPPKTDFELPIRSDQLLRVFLNLLLNAAEAADANPNRSPRVAVEINANDSSISVFDSGLGFGCLDAATAVMPFVSTRNRFSEHHGLGLASVHSIIAPLGGKVAVDSTSQGTTVSIGFSDSAFVRSPGTERSNRMQSLFPPISKMN